MSESKELSIVSPLVAFKKDGLDLEVLQNTFAELPSPETDEGYEFIKSGIKELRGYNTFIDEKYEEINRPILIFKKAFSSEKDRLKSGIKGMLSRLVSTKSEYDNRKKREKEELEEKINKQISGMREKSEIAIGKTSKEISDLINEVGEVDVSHGFYHLTNEAAKVRNETLEKLTTMLSNELQAEKARDELAEFKRKEAEREEKEIEDAWEMALGFDVIFNYKREAQAKKDAEIQAEADKVAKAEQVANDKRIKDEADKKARKDAAEAIEKAEKDAEDAKVKAKNAETARIAAEKKAKDDKEEARRQAIIDRDKAALDAKEKAENAAKIEANRIEKARLEDERKKKADDKRRADDVKHAGKIHTGIVSKMIELGASKEIATKIVISMARKEFNNVRINY